MHDPQQRQPRSCHQGHPSSIVQQGMQQQRPEAAAVHLAAAGWCRGAGGTPSNASWAPPGASWATRKVASAAGVGWSNTTVDGKSTPHALHGPREREATSPTTGRSGERMQGLAPYAEGQTCT